MLEKVALLLQLLDAVRSHPFLKDKLVLKGGTALNLFIFDVPRLSIDIDLNYVGAADRETMLAERPKVEEALQAVFSREGFTVRRVPTEHAGGKWQLRYPNAGEYHGAAHQRPQVYQVVTARNRPQINCGRIRVQFIARKNMEQIPTSDLMTPHGYLKVSTPAATAFDLVGYFHSAVGMNNVATVLAELSECIDEKNLVAVAALSPIAWAQRLGYLFELVGAEDKTGELADYIAREKPAPTPLVPSQPFRGISQLQRWRLLVNDTVESDV